MFDQPFIDYKNAVMNTMKWEATLHEFNQKRMSGEKSTLHVSFFVYKGLYMYQVYSIDRNVVIESTNPEFVDCVVRMYSEGCMPEEIQ